MSAKNGNPHAKKSPPDDVAVLLMAHGGPESLDDVEPFLRHIMKERVPSPEVIAQVRERYRLIGGKSPLLEITKQQAAALETELNKKSSQFHVYLGMRHASPFIKETVQQIIKDAPAHLIAISLAPHYSKLSVGAYIQALQTALADAGSDLPVTAVESWHDQPLLLDAFAKKVKEALNNYPAELRSTVPILFTAHSLPERVLAEGDPYPKELEGTVKGVAQRLGQVDYRFAYQSRGMSPGKWLGPEVDEVLNDLAAKEEKNLLIVPIGFVCDHVEILYDIDILYKETAQSKGIALRRTESLNASPLFIQALAAIVHTHLPM
ncbi:MAG: ferrochelatase [Candidatus Manganitrophaceae bacterium]|nr:MAG: ferrochelatase [Candidatus Manganitrophaceae bacterium]